MKKKLQVFISSTYIDMIEERQAAVTAVLNAGHIPAGMELFKSGDQSQKETIKRWIDESDVYMLILGGRYGSIDPESGKSYTHWEYDYAGEQGKRRFAIVIKDAALREKAKLDPDFMERENSAMFRDFKTNVLGNISEFYEDIKDIKIIVMGSLRELENDRNLTGWVRANEIPDMEKTLRENGRLLKSIEKLKNENRTIREEQKAMISIGNLEYSELKVVLKHMKVNVPEKYKGAFDGKTMLDFFLGLSSALATGVSTEYKVGSQSGFIILNIIPTLMNFGLVEKVRVSGSTSDKLQTSREGLKFLAHYELEKIRSGSLNPVKD